MSAHSKRQASGMDVSNIVDGPRKRRKDASLDSSGVTTKPGGSPPLKITLKLRRGATDAQEDSDLDAHQSPDDTQPDRTSADSNTSHPAKLKQLGIDIWSAVKNAKDSKYVLILNSISVSGRYLATSHA
jgi:hypothetical protein